MTERGFIALARGVLDHPIVGARKPYTAHDAWEWLLFEAAWKPRRYAAGPIVAHLERGQLAHSIRYMAKAWGWSGGTVQRFLTRLKTDTMIDTATDTGLTVITICNYDAYQNGPADSDTATDTPGDTRAIQQRYRKEQGNKETKDSRSEPDGFAAWYEVYPKHVDRRSAARAYKAALGRRDCSIESLLAAAQRYAAETAGVEKRFIKHPATWLNASSYLNEAAAAAVPSGDFKIAAPTPRDPKTFTEQEWRDRLGTFKSQGKWSSAWGPPPGSPGCLVPSPLAMEAA